MKKRHEESFKRQAVELAESLSNVSEAARQLGLADSLIYAWRNKYGKANGQQGNGRLTIHEREELNRLRRENAKLKKVNHILKSAAAFFSQDHLK